jgi:nicotinamide-nucleotide amidase
VQHSPTGTPTAEIITVGDELTSGQRLDTNSRWLSRRLGDIGVRTLFHTTTADDAGAIGQALDVARRRAQVLLVTGGLGPTADDLTRQVLADLAGVPLELHEPSLQHIRQLFQTRGRVMPEKNVVQAMLPAGAAVIPNHSGTAPGIDLQFRNPAADCRLFALPGVPAELKPMWYQHVQPAIRKQFPQLGLIVHHAIHCFGLAESDVEARMPDLIQRGRIPAVGITASQATITLRISASGKTVEACQALIEPTAELIRQELGDFVFGENGATLPSVVVALLRRAGRTFSVVDLGSCSLIADWMHEADPEGSVYRGTLGLAGRSTRDRRRLVGTARETFDSELVLVIGPTFDHCGILKRDFAICSPRRQIRHRSHAASNPAILIPRSVKQALNFMRLAVERGKI